VNRPEAVAVVVLAIFLAWGLMYVGWKRRQARQSDVAPLPAVPEGLAERARAEGVEGSYVSTTTATDPLDRITAHGLGDGGVAHVLVADGGSAEAGVLVAPTRATPHIDPATPRARRRTGGPSAAWTRSWRSRASWASPASTPAL
jgi:hypothetical protein